MIEEWIASEVSLYGVCPAARLGAWLSLLPQNGKDGAHTSTPAGFHVDSIEPLFQLDLPNFVGISFDVSPDAKQFVVQTTDHTKSTSITFADKLARELKK